MRFNVKEKPDRKEWHRHFAWWPVKVEHQYVWLERVHRKLVKASYGWEYEYRLGK